ncbi:MAG: hypothetical protein V7711_13540 [Pseudomonadales bacterium]
MLTLSPLYVARKSRYVLVSVLLVLGACSRGPLPNPLDDIPLIGKTAIAKPIVVPPIPAHPWLAPQGVNGIHADSYMSDSYTWPGPLARQAQLQSTSFAQPVGSCPSHTFDSQGRMIATCVTFFGIKLAAFDPTTLEVIAEKSLGFQLAIGNNFSGGVYFHLDQDDQVLLVDSKSHIRTYALTGNDSDLSWVETSAINIAPALDAAGPGPHSVIDVMPDWQGNYWFITRAGLVGYSLRDGSQQHAIALQGEDFDNALAVAQDGVYAVSNHAMYRFEADQKNTVNIGWRATYDRGPSPKPGTMGHGSGTTPTLIGEDYVAVTDNAAGRIKLLVYRRQQDLDQPRLVCAEPIFEADKGTSENSLAVAGNSVIIENNYGYQGPKEGLKAEPGISRVDIRPDGSGCDTIWENKTVSSPSSVPKISLANGLIYLYTRIGEDRSDDNQQWSLTTLDFTSGELVYKIPTGSGMDWNNHYAAITLAPDGSAIVGTIKGLIRIKDAP